MITDRMSTRSVFLEVSHPDLEFIEGLRARFDPLFGKIAPHISLVLPFENNVSTADLVSLLDFVAPAHPLPFNLGKPETSGTNLYFPLMKGASEVIALRDTLYQGLPDLTAVDFRIRPRLVFGHLSPRESAAVLQEAAAGISVSFGKIISVVLERVGSHSESIVEHRKIIGA